MNGSVLRLAVPSILANITIPLVGIVDVAVIGHISNAAAVGGIAIGTMLFDLLYWNFGFLRVGTSGMTAQAYGRADQRGAVSLLTQSLSIAMGATALIWLLQWFFVTAVLWCMPCSPEVADFARQYFFVRIWAAPATLSLMAFKGWFIGMQNTIAPMLTDIVVNVVNMLASYALAVYTPLGAIGVAWGTLIAQYTGLLTAILFLLIKYRPLLALTNLRESLRWGEIRQLFVLNSNLFLRSLCFMIVYVGYTAFASEYGDTELAVSAILMKLFMLFSYFVDGFAYAGEALSGRFGAQADGGWRKTRDVRTVVKVLFMWAMVVGLFFTALYAVFSKEMIALMTSDMLLQQTARPYYIWLAMMPLVSSLAFMWDGIYLGATEGVAVRNCMVWAAVGFVIAYFSLSGMIGMQAVYVGYFVHLLARTLYLTIRWRFL